MPVAIDKPVPDFTAPATSGKEVTARAPIALRLQPKRSSAGVWKISIRIEQGMIDIDRLLTPNELQTIQ